LVERRVDLPQAGPPGINFRRAYMSNYARMGLFGVGTWHSLNSYLKTEDRMASLDWEQENGDILTFRRLVPGVGFRSDAGYESDDEDPLYPLYHASLSWAAHEGRFKLKLQDSCTYTFLSCGENDFCFWKGYTEPAGFNWVFDRDSTGLLHSVKGPHSSVSLDYDSANRITSVRGGDGREVKYSYAATGQLERVEYPDGSSSLYDYNPSGKMAVISLVIRRGAPAALIAHADYDKSGRVVSLADVSGNVYSFKYLGTRNEWNYVQIVRPNSTRDTIGINDKDNAYVWWSRPVVSTSDKPQADGH